MTYEYNGETRDLFSGTQEPVLHQPNLTRQRHRFRGPRESHKINLELNQIRYDLLNLQAKRIQLNEAITGLSSNLETGSDSTESIVFEDGEEIMGLEDLMQRINNIRVRIRRF